MYKIVIFAVLFFITSCGDKKEFSEKKDFELIDYELIDIDYGLRRFSHDFEIPSFQRRDN